MQISNEKAVRIGIMVLVMLVSLIFVTQGILMHAKLNKEEQRFHALQDSYYSINKAQREAAFTNSELNEQHVEIQQYPSLLSSLRVVGLGKILIGVYILLFGILAALVIKPKGQSGSVNTV